MQSNVQAYEAIVPKTSWKYQLKSINLQQGPLGFVKAIGLQL